ncbi:MAG: 4Fe-4S binding protein [Erysipelotrichaceae bacterium]|nr:4Fe-4S binding protein [Erysipelotrichaceae bacterium]
MPAKVNINLCVGCNVCVTECLSDAITCDETAVVNEKVCDDCGDCAKVCPTGAMTME